MTHSIGVKIGSIFHVLGVLWVAAHVPRGV